MHFVAAANTSPLEHSSCPPLQHVASSWVHKVMVTGDPPHDIRLLVDRREGVEQSRALWKLGERGSGEKGRSSP